MNSDNINASPQVENGFTKIANELLEAIYNTNLSAYETRIVMFIIRLTYGFEKKMDAISLSQFEDGIIKKDGTIIAKGTNLKHRHICEVISRLIEKNIIIKSKDGYITQYGIQKDYTKWATGTPTSTTRTSTTRTSTARTSTWGSTPTSTESSTRTSTESSTRTSTHQINDINERNYTKEKKSTPIKESLEDFINNLKSDKTYEWLDIDQQWKECQQWWSDNDKVMKKPKSCLRTWLKHSLSKPQNGFNSKNNKYPSNQSGINKHGIDQYK
jgi:phage replication O-like protein O